MFSTARATKTQQQAHHKHPSIIRTRSQQPHPLSPADLSASPLKEAIRSRKQNYTHIHNHIHISTPHTLDETKYEEHTTPPLIDFAKHDLNRVSPSSRKRASSPSFVTDHDAKRTRILGESTRANTLHGRHSKVSHNTGHPEAAPSPENLFPSAERAVSTESSGNAVSHLDLAKVPQSPSKALASPSKLPSNVPEGGSKMKVPVILRKELDGHNDKAEAVQVILQDPSGFTDVLEGPSSISTEDHPSAAQNGPPPFDQKHFLGPLHINDTNTDVPPSTPTSFQSRSLLRRRLGDFLLFGDSPITPLPALSHAIGRDIPPKISHSPSGKEKSAESSISPAPPISLQSVRRRQSSPTKSRIPVPAGTSTSRIPRPSSLFMSDTIEDNSSNPVRDSRHRPKSKQKMYRKPKVDLRSRPPTTRLAVKRGIRRMSSAATGLRLGSSTSTGANVPSRDGAGSSKSESTETASKIDKKRPFLTSSRTSSENMANPRTSSLFPHTAPSSGSPMKPTPLSALSTALQKLLVTPPAAPVRRPRPNASPNFSGDHNASKLAQSQNDDAAAVFEAPKTPSTENKFQRHETSTARSRLSGTPQGIGMIGLPMRRPGSITDAGMPAPSSNALFVRKRTNLSTVPASPAPDAVVIVECDASPSSPAAHQRDTRVSSYAHVEGERREKGGNVDFTVPLVDESHPRRPLVPELVSPSRRASHASLSLTQSLTFPRVPPGFQLARSTSASSGLKFNPRSPVKTRGRTKPPPPPESDTTTKDPMNGKRSNARMPGSLDVLKDCVIFVDVKTEEGEEAGALFVDMLRGLGSRILLKPGKSCTHLVYKDGSPATITKYKLLPEPRPLLVSIGWVVECVEKREHVDETRFLVDLDELGGVGSAQRRRSMQPKQMRTMTIGQFDSGQSADISVRADSSFTSEDQSTSGPILAALSPATRILHGSLPPLERARQRSLHLSHKP